MKVRSISLTAVVCASAVALAAASPAHAYNDQQHQGMVAVAYKAMVAAALEQGCPSPVDFKGGSPAEEITDLPDVSVCGPNTAACAADWSEFLRESERSMRYLRGVNSALQRDGKCPSGFDYTGPLGEIAFAVSTGYARSGSCGVIDEDLVAPGEIFRRCSAPAELCDVDSIYQFLAPEDHTGDILGYWATEPDHDPSTTAVGFKPVNPLVNLTLQTADDVVSTSLGAVLVPFYCAFQLLFGDDEGCVGDAQSLADLVTPIDEIGSAVPVLFPRRDDDFLGLWHFMHVQDSYSPCDDKRGMFYERAGPRSVPDPLDFMILVGTTLGMQFLKYEDSTGASRFNITDPGDGDQASCQRDRADWELVPLGHTLFSPVDNLGLWGWKEFTLGTTRDADLLGWPLHALGDAVAPHHVVGTTGWGHRPFEDAAERNWKRILYQDVAPTSTLRVQQYGQLRRILVQGFAYWRRLAELRAARPDTASFHAIPIRAFVTEVAQDTYETVTTSSGLPLWPYDPTLSVQYFADFVGSKESSIAVYSDVDDVERTRALMERGSASMVAFLTTVGRLGAPFAPSDRCGEAGAMFAECGASSACSGSCCIPAVSACNEPCDRSLCSTPTGYCESTCSAGRACDPSGCCVVTACDVAPCGDSGDCPNGSDCISGCCGPVVR